MESLPTSPIAQSVDWGNEIGLLDSLSSLWDEICRSYLSDPMYGTAWFTHHNPRDYLKDNGLIFKIPGDKHLLCIPEGKFDRKTLLEYDHTLLAHLGVNKTYLYLRSFINWPKMQDDIRAYCKQCQTCATRKSGMQKPWGC